MLPFLYRKPDRSAPAVPRQAGPLLVVLAMLLLPLLAWGFVLPGPFVLARGKERLAELAGVQVELEVEQAGEVQRETLRIDRQGVVRQAPANQRVGVYALSQLLGGRLIELVGELGIDAARTSLARLDGRVVIVVGALHGEVERPQLWVDQQTFFPVRLQAGGRDLVLSDLFSPLTNGRFPRLLQVRQQGSLLWQARVIRFEKEP